MRVSIAAICLPIPIFWRNIDPGCFENLAHSVGIEHSGIEHSGDRALRLGNDHSGGLGIEHSRSEHLRALGIEHSGSSTRDRALGIEHSGSSTQDRALGIERSVSSV